MTQHFELLYGPFDGMLFESSPGQTIMFAHDDEKVYFYRATDDGFFAHSETVAIEDFDWAEWNRGLADSCSPPPTITIRSQPSA